MRNQHNNKVSRDNGFLTGFIFICSLIIVSFIAIGYLLYYKNIESIEKSDIINKKNKLIVSLTDSLRNERSNIKVDTFFITPTVIKSTVKLNTEIKIVESTKAEPIDTTNTDQQ